MKTENRVSPEARARGLRLKGLRIERDVPVEVMAKELGRSSQAVYQWETGRTEFSYSELPSIATALGVSLETLVKRLFPQERETTSRFRPAIGAPQGIGRGLMGVATA